MLRLFAVALILCGCGFADDHADREKLWGTWTSFKSTDKTGPGSIVLKNDGTALTLSETQGSRKVSDFECNIMGKECKVKVGGRDATVTMYFNGARLIELETTRKEVVKRRFQASPDGKELQIEIIPIVPQRDPETLRFRRVPETTADVQR